MPKGHAIGAAEKVDIYEAVKSGVPVKDVASDFGISEQTVRGIFRKFKLAEDHEGERIMDSILAGDKYNGLLRCIGADTYEGTCRLPNGKFKTKIFRTTGSRAAEGQWSRWCEDIRNESVSDKAEAPAVTITPAPIPEVTVTRRTEPEPVKTDDKAQHVVLVEPNAANAGREPIYIVFATLPNESEPKFLGWTTFERAIQQCDSRNESLEFLGLEPSYKVAELRWLD